MKGIIKFVVVLATTILLLIFQSANSQNKSFVNIKEVIPSIQLDIRYYTNYNFVGQRINGYNAPKCLLTQDASQSLSKVQEELMRKSYSLKIYDCYRPQKAVNHFVIWAGDMDDQKMKAEFYPNIDKQNLFIEGYIANRSSHSRGSTVDLTIVPIPTPPHEVYSPSQPFSDNSIDMGTSFDFFDPSSHTFTNKVNGTQRKNRLLLKAVMEKHGFRNYSREWWHYTFNDEPFANTYFDFPIS